MSDSEFDTSIKTLKDAQQAGDLLVQARIRLRPVLADSQQALKDFHILAASLQPEIHAAIDAQQKAARVGVRNPSLEDCIKRVGEMLIHGPNGFKSVIEMCEGLTLYQAGQHRFMHDLESGSLLNQYKAVMPALRDAVKTLGAHLHGLEVLVADAAMSRPAPTTGPISQGASILEQAAAQRPAPNDGPGL